MSKHISLPIKVQLEQVLHIMGYMNNNKKMRLVLYSSKPTVKESWFKEYYLI